MAAYRTKPCEIQAVQWFSRIDHPRHEGHPQVKEYALGVGWIETRQGAARVDPGDWLITLPDGETYPCKPDVFAAKYDPKER